MSTIGDQLVYKRRNIKGQITRIFNYLVDLNVEDALLESIETRVERLVELFNQFNDVQGEIEDLSSGDECSTQRSHRESVETTYFEAKSMALRYTKQLQKPSETSSIDQCTAESSRDEFKGALKLLVEQQTQLSTLIARNTSTNSNTSNNTTPFASDISDLRLLPKLDIPTFNGTYKDWPEFHDNFKRLVHENNLYGDSLKLQYLKKALIGKARDIFKNLPATDANYKEAYKELVETYDKSSIIIDSYFQTIMEQKRLSVANSECLRNLCHNIAESVRALTAMKLPTEHWDAWLVYVFASKLDDETRKLWRREQNQKSGNSQAKFTDLVSFVKDRIFELTPVKEQYTESKTSRSGSTNAKTSHIAIVTDSKCSCCEQNHFLYACPKFQQMPIESRRNFVKQKNCCFNCLRSSHVAKKCPSKSTCKKCNSRHHTMLHDPSASGSTSAVSSPSASTSSTTPDSTSSLSSQTPISASPKGNTAVSSHTVASNELNTTLLLPTAMILVKGKTQTFQPCRVLLDTGSQVSLISRRCLDRLMLVPRSDNRHIIGVGSSVGSTTKLAIDITIRSRIKDFETVTSAFVLDKVTSYLPATPVTVNSSCSSLFKNIELADPMYNKPSAIDILLSADIFFQVLLSGKLSIGPTSPIALETLFGWVISGPGIINSAPQTYTLHTCVDVNQTLKAFWELEDIPTTPGLSEEENQAENHFVETHRRTATGRYVVRLPFKNISEQLGNSKSNAISSLKSLEHRFNGNCQLRDEYCSFINEYLDLNHMRKVSPKIGSMPYSQCFYMPHHAVVKETSSTTRLRVVFDASRKSSSGISLNNMLLLGPNIQTDIWPLLLTFRIYHYAYTGDIAKMYRQILVDPRDTPFQRIVWRSSADEEVGDYELLTVTYGTKSAPFLAVRTLKQLANDEAHNYPIGSKQLHKKFYIDDFIGGSHTLPEALHVKSEITGILSKGGFQLRKWTSNCSEFLDSIPEDLRESHCLLPGESEPCVKTLGMKWLPIIDSFIFQVNLESTNIFSKRFILSEISKIYDPTGLLAPCIILAKIIMQEIWILGVSWDDPLPENIMRKYQTFRNSLQDISELKIPRWLGVKQHSVIQLCGFADASEKAYAGVVYMRLVEDNQVTVRLLASKTRVAPIKQISLPRLELCAAHLLSKLISNVKLAMEYQEVEVMTFTDSTTVLAWLQKLPRTWTTFVGNRTSSILSSIPSNFWRHVRSSENSADPASRGLTGTDLVNCNLWFEGPNFLKDVNYGISAEPVKVYTTELEVRTFCFHTIFNGTSVEEVEEFLNRYSKIEQLKRTTAWILRFATNCKESTRTKIKEPILLVRELEHALTTLLKMSQSISFGCEISALMTNKPISNRSKLISLNPFIDSVGVLRVGGRIQSSSTSYNKIHPVILLKGQSLAALIVENIHLTYLHAGQQLMLNIIHLRYWIVGGKSLVRNCIRRCVTCIKYRAATSQQLMGSLPHYRLQPARAFTNTGTDFAGPFSVRTWSGRGAKVIKAYIALFVCLSTRALHLELVTSLSTDMFLAAFHRFAARRGLCSNLYSDNGRNYVGAARKLKEVHIFLQKHSTDIGRALSTNNVTWHFIPVSTPHFGGIWESAVKSVKGHLKRVVGETTLTQEEMATLLCQIEGCLNSRPIAPKSADIDDLEALTPGHFLTMGPIILPQQEPLNDRRTTYSTRWEFVQRLTQQFWKRWSLEYLPNLQQRKKWQWRSRNLRLNDLVIIKEDNLPPCCWLLGRVVETKPGADGLVRVVRLKTKAGMLERSIHKLCVLISSEEDE